MGSLCTPLLCLQITGVELFCYKPIEQTLQMCNDKVSSRLGELLRFCTTLNLVDFSLKLTCDMGSLCTPLLGLQITGVELFCYKSIEQTLQMFNVKVWSRQNEFWRFYAIELIHFKKQNYGDYEPVALRGIPTPTRSSFTNLQLFSLVGTIPVNCKKTFCNFWVIEFMNNFVDFNHVAPQASEFQSRQL